MNVLPAPRSLGMRAGSFVLPKRTTLQLDGSLPPDVACAITERLASAAKGAGVELILGNARLRRAPAGNSPVEISANRDDSRSAQDAPAPYSEFYTLTVDQHGVRVQYHEVGGLRAAMATLRQLLREYGRRLPCLEICDWPDFARRGVMLDISRGRVPKLETLLDLADHLADFKINELQLYTEHTFAYRQYKSVWQGWGALTGPEIRRLDIHCRKLGVDLVPNQNSFGHLRYFLEHPKLKKLAEVSEAYEDATSGVFRRPTTLAPNHPGTLPFLRVLYDELLPNFSSRFFNVGCDEPWDLGCGQSKELCERLGTGRVYLDFLKKIHREVLKHGKRMMFWGDIILNYPELIPELPRDVVALNWGYEANCPFQRDAKLFARAGIQFYVCPGTSTWLTLIGRHDNAFANLHAAAKAGRKYGAIGDLITDWGDGGHPQPLAVSWLPYLFGASVGWCAASFDKAKLVPVLSRDVFHDLTGLAARAALALGHAHRKLRYTEPNLTPLGAVIAAPPPERHEMFCRNGLKYYAHISERRIRATLREIQRQRALLSRSKPASRSGKILVRELNLAARMAAQSCQFMLWQQALAMAGMRRRVRFGQASGSSLPNLKKQQAQQMAVTGIRELKRLNKEFNDYWPLRNKGTTAHCSSFLRWRIRDYQRGSWSSVPQ